MIVKCLVTLSESSTRVYLMDVELAEGEILDEAVVEQFIPGEALHVDDLHTSWEITNVEEVQ